MPPLISLVVPTFNVARYLPEFLASLDAQDGGLVAIEVVFVDDGSSDGSAGLLAAWVAAHPQASAQVVTKVNGGLASARNAGLAAATGEWVSFPDPDDILTPGYLTAVRVFLASDRAVGVELIATNVVFLFEENGEKSDTHPLRFKFSSGHHKIVDLDRKPEYIHLSAATGLYRRARLLELGLTFDGRIYPTFEDGHLTGRYLAAAEHPRLALVEDAVYLYRRRADQSSQVQSGWAKREKYEDIPRYGWLDLLRVAAERGSVPRWMQYLVLYDLFFYFRAELRPDSASRTIPEQWRVTFLATLEEVMRYIDTRSIVEFSVTKVRSEVRRAVLFGVKGTGQGRSDVYADQLDPDAALVRLRYFVMSGELPAEAFTADDAPVEPASVETRDLSFYGRVMLRERTAWLPADKTLAVALDGIAAVVHVGSPGMPRYSAKPSAIRDRLGEPGPGTAPEVVAASEGGGAWWRRRKS